MKKAINFTWIQRHSTTIFLSATVCILAGIYKERLKDLNLHFAD